PWPALNRLFLHLYSKDDCSDLANLAQVSTHFHYGVHEFMRRDDNRPAYRQVALEKNKNGVIVEVSLIPSNLPFYDLTTRDSGRFERLGDSTIPYFRVAVNGPEDPIMDKMIYLNYGSFPAGFIMAAQMLRGSATHLPTSTSRI
ncbi:hypothetical protein PMAYCL1PPCAC_03287, partial [Pristionchus mayeri]